MNEICRLNARDVVALLRKREITPADAVGASLARIAEVDPAVNALPTLCEAHAREAAARLIGEAIGPVGLAGLPIVVKDLNEVGGVRTTYGSPIFADHVPRHSDLTVGRLQSRGAVVLAKSNTPEFGAGANTFNEVFGKTRNPWNTAKTCGGSSGGSAVALATGMAWAATGSDLGGSLRTPAAFCSVVGLRPSVGRVPRSVRGTLFESLWVEGPMARNVLDVALMLDAMAGEDIRDPLSLPAPPVPFLEAAARRTLPRKVAFSRDLGGIIPIAREVAGVLEQAVRRLEAAGVTVVEDGIDFRDARDAFQTLRAAGFAASHGHLLRTKRDRLKPEIVWNIEKGLALTAEDIARADAARVRLFARTLAFFDRCDLLLCPAAAVAPFDIDIRSVAEIEGRTLETYIDWLAVTFAITLTTCPALSLPCGFTADGLPVGLQIVARPRAEADLLSAAAAFEEVLGVANRVPIDPQLPV